MIINSFLKFNGFGDREKERGGERVKLFISNRELQIRVKEMCLLIERRERERERESNRDCSIGVLYLQVIMH